MAIKHLQWHANGPGWYHDGGDFRTWKGPFETSLAATRAFQDGERRTVVVSTTEVDHNGDHIEAEIPEEDLENVHPLDQPFTRRDMVNMLARGHSYLAASVQGGIEARDFLGFIRAMVQELEGA